MSINLTRVYRKIPWLNIWAALTVQGKVTPMTESFAEMFEESLANQELRRGAVVTGTVVDIQSDNVIVHAGLKSEGIIPIEQFKNAQGDLEVEVGDEVEVSLEAVEDGFGETRLSREKAKRDQVWRRLEEAFEKEEIVKGVISGKVKGGFTVDIDDIRAFLPGSLVDVRPVRDPAYLEGKDLEFKVIKLDKRRNNVVVSRRAVVETEFSAEREALLESLQEGIVVKGIVKNLTDYGVFVDLGGIDGLLHITDMAWKRVHHPSEVVEIGQEIDVKVLKYDQEKMRVSLGLKQLGDDPWVNITRRYPEGTRLFGKVTNIADYGAFVEIEEGVEGLVHVSEMDWTNKNIHPSKVVQLGDEVEVMVLDIDEERRRDDHVDGRSGDGDEDLVLGGLGHALHLGGATHEVTDHQSRIAWESLAAFLEGDPVNVVNPEAVAAASSRLQGTSPPA